MLKNLKHIQSIIGLTKVNRKKLSHGKDIKNQKKTMRSQWEDMLDILPNIEWSNSESSILLSFERNNYLCHGKFSKNPDVFQTLLLGVDLDNNQILVDELFPKPPVKISLANFELKFNSDIGVLILQVEVAEQYLPGDHSVMLLNILDKRLIPDRRSNTRISFERSSAPSMKLLVPMCPEIKGHISNLSNLGLNMHFFGPNMSEINARNGECTLFFDKGIQLDLKVKIKQVIFSRKACSSCQVRMLFCDTKVAELELLKTFIDTYQQNHRQEQVA